MNDLPNFSLGENVRIVNFPDGDLLNGATGTFMGISTNDGYIGIVLLDVPTETHLAITLPVVCIEHAGPKSFVTDELLNEAMLIQNLRSDRVGNNMDRHWMTQSLEAVLSRRLTGQLRPMFPNAPGLDEMLRSPRD